MKLAQASVNDLQRTEHLPCRQHSSLGQRGGNNAAGIGLFHLNHCSRVIFWSVLCLLCFTSVAVARTDENKPNPLEVTTPDPLLPQSAREQPLSQQERQTLEAALDELNAQALAQFQAGNRQGALELWFRELRLRRALGPVQEVQALGRVGEIAWNENSKSEVQIITARLQTIQQEAQAKKTLDQPLLMALGKAYQQVRVPGQALAIYEQILADARQQGDSVAQQETLQTIGLLHMAWFDYPKAAATYEELLTLAQAQGNRVKELNYLQQLLYIYDQAKQPENALRIKQELLGTYPSNDPRIPALKIAIAADYEALNQSEEASQNYQQAYTLAYSLQQLNNAGEALQRLAALYRSHNYPEFALEVYQVLLKVRQQSYDYYGLMNTYDQIGQIYLAQNSYSQAKEAFQQALALAQSLQHQEEYFTAQLEQVNQQSSQ